MRNNLQWFQSPRPSCFNFSQAQQQQEQFADLAQIHPSTLTPTPMAHHPLSPFIPLPPADRQEPPPAHLREQEEAKRGINQLVVFSEEEDEGEALTPEAHHNSRKNEEVLTTGRKSSAERPQGVKKSRPKDKGLRGLSLKALHTVIAMRQGTYKEVAAQLLGEEGGERAANEQTNIKRRVYDALNVLISLGLLKKQGRLIVGDTNPLDKAKEDIKEYNRLRSKIAIKEFVLEEKRDKLRETHEKCRGIQGLFANNHQNHQRIQQDGTFISFPFIGVLTDASEWSIAVQSEQEVEMRFKQMVHPFGDIDSLRQLQKHFK